MSLKINYNRAKEILMEEAQASTKPVQLDPLWCERVETLSLLCERAESRTHIAFLGTVMLAKAVNVEADLFAIKPEHAPGNPHAFSARTLCHTVLVPLARDLGINIGVTGREPLNNQPYFRMTRFGDETPVHERAKEAFAALTSLVQALQGLTDEAFARSALRSYVAVRRRYQWEPDPHSDASSLSPTALLEAIRRFVIENSEGGRRAQAIVAGLMDLVYGEDRVDSGRINDPSRHFPGDVCIRSRVAEGTWVLAIEVRDKPVSLVDIQIFCDRATRAGISDTVIVAVADHQPPLDMDAVRRWAAVRGIAVTTFQGWTSLVEQALLWAGEPSTAAASRAARLIHRRLVAVEASPESVERWHQAGT